MRCASLCPRGDHARCELAVPDWSDPATRRFALLEYDGEPPPRVTSRATGDPVLYRTVEGGTVICRAHVVECRAYTFRGGPLRVVAVGPRERLRALIPPTCALCRTVVAHGNTCYLERCAAPLHPQWPAVYCSDACALEDA